MSTGKTEQALTAEQLAAAFVGYVEGVLGVCKVPAHVFDAFEARADEFRAALTAAPTAQPQSEPSVNRYCRAGMCVPTDAKHEVWCTAHAPAQPPERAAQQEAHEAAKNWDGAEEWMPLAWELCANECGEEACSELVWEGGAVPEPWGDRWLKYEDEAKRLIALVRKHVPASPPRAVEPLKACADKPGVVYVNGYGYVDEKAVRAIERAHNITKE